MNHWKIKHMEIAAVLALFCLGICSSVPELLAKSHGSNDTGKAMNTPAGFTQGDKSGWKKNDTAAPPGWAHGKKKGWNGTQTPPGLAKKKT